MVDPRVIQLFNGYHEMISGTFGPGYETLAAILTAAQWIGQNIQDQTVVQFPGPPRSPENND